MSYLLDTNIISEPRKRTPNPQVVHWLKTTPKTQLFISSITIAEISAGQHLAKNPEIQESLLAWLEYRVKPQFASQTLAVTTEIAEVLGRSLKHAQELEQSNRVFDLIIAATAIVHDLVVVTRNVKHFKPFPIKVLNPFI